MMSIGSWYVGYKVPAASLDVHQYQSSVIPVRHWSFMEGCNRISEIICVFPHFSMVVAFVSLILLKRTPFFLINGTTYYIQKTDTVQINTK